MSIKNTKRKGFNFFRSYFDVYNELPEKDKLPFIDALLNKQFLGIDPTDLKDMAKFAWISQVHSITEQVKGYESKTGDKLNPTEGGSNTPTQQVQVKEEAQVQVIEKVKGAILNSKIWFDPLFMKRKIELEEGFNCLEIFLDKQEDMVGEGNGLNREQDEIKNHFVNWLDIALDKMKKSNNKQTLEQEFEHLIP